MFADTEVELGESGGWGGGLQEEAYVFETCMFETALRLQLFDSWD